MTRHAPPRTSLDAYHSVSPSDKRSLQAAITREALKGPDSSHGFAKRLGQPPERVWKRISELISMGVLEPTGQLKENDTGRKARVVQPTEYARAFLSGDYEPEDPQHRRQRTRARFFRALRTVMAAKPGSDETIAVPMHDMVELRVAYDRANEQNVL